VSGGSAANAAKAAAALGFRCAFSVCVGSEDREADRWALAFERDLADYGVRCVLETRPKPTGRCLVIHMPGDLTSVACAPSAASLFRSGQVDDLPEATFVLLDGQTLRNPELVSAAARLAGERARPSRWTSPPRRSPTSGPRLSSISSRRRTSFCS
jgi:sugar/nucleoside kinase (ribokinase family)